MTRRGKLLIAIIVGWAIMAGIASQVADRPDKPKPVTHLQEHDLCMALGEMTGMSKAARWDACYGQYLRH